MDATIKYLHIRVFQNVYLSQSVLSHDHVVVSEFVFVCAHATLRRFLLWDTCTVLAVISYTHTILLCVCKLILCVSRALMRCLSCVSTQYWCVPAVCHVCGTYSNVCVIVNVRFVCVCVCLCVCVVKTQPSMGALMSKCILLSLLLGFM